MTIYATNGAKLFIGGVLAAKAGDFVQADFASQEWAEVGELEGLGSIGDAAAEITFDSISGNRTRRLKGTRNAGTMEVVCGIDYQDPGQVALLAAEKTRHDHAFKLVLNDAPVGGTPSERYFVAAVGSAVEALDTANNVMKLNASLWVNSNVVRVNAAAA
uniref:Phage tail protein n=1 Tax=Cereibacter sphaeroides (strain ATCC 17025 / ATH 2.4.3) TaxID=349102 RepID=A4WS96_CERS5